MHPATLSPSDWQAVIHSRTEHRIGDLANLATDSNLDWVHERDAALTPEAQETFGVLIECACRLVQRALDDPREPLPADQLEQLQAVIDSLPRVRSTGGEL